MSLLQQLLSRQIAHNALPLRMPADPAQAQVIRDWAAERGLHLIEKGTYGYKPPSAYPYTCKNGHRVAGPEDERKQGKYLRCGVCRNNQRGKRRAA